MPPTFLLYGILSKTTVCPPKCGDEALSTPVTRHLTKFVWYLCSKHSACRNYYFWLKSRFGVAFTEWLIERVLSRRPSFMMSLCPKLVMSSPFIKVLKQWEICITRWATFIFLVLVCYQFKAALAPSSYKCIMYVT